MNQKRKRRLLIEAAVIIAVVGMAAYIYTASTPEIFVYLKQNDIDGLTDFIRGEGQMGEIFLIALQVIETISIFLPALPVYICAGIIYGRFEGSLLCYITNLIMNAIMFLGSSQSRRQVGTKNNK